MRRLRIGLVGLAVIRKGRQNTMTRGSTSSGSYSSGQKSLHWIIAIAVLCSVPAGLVMVRIPQGVLQDRLYDLHRSLGMTILVLALIRLALRIARGAPPPVATLTSFQRTASAVVHRLLYVLIVLMPLVGWAAMSAYGGDWSVFGVFAPQPIMPKSETLSNVFFKLHDLGGFMILGVILVHIGAALMHGFILRDGVLARMLPNGGGTPTVSRGK
jgi:cytochrome b561